MNSTKGKAKRRMNAFLDRDVFLLLNSPEMRVGK